MKKTVIEKIGYILIGAVATSAFFVINNKFYKEKVVERLVTAIDEGKFCHSDTENKEDVATEIDEVYFVGCGGFF